MGKKNKKQKAKKIDRGTEVCTRLLDWRDKSGLSQTEASRLIGVKVRTYQNWEQGRRRPTGLSLTALETFIKKVEHRAGAAAA